MALVAACSSSSCAYAAQAEMRMLLAQFNFHHAAHRLPANSLSRAWKSGRRRGPAPEPIANNYCHLRECCQCSKIKTSSGSWDKRHGLQAVLQLLCRRDLTFSEKKKNKSKQCIENKKGGPRSDTNTHTHTHTHTLHTRTCTSN